MPVTLSGEQRRGGVCIFMAGGLQKRRIIAPQKVCKADLHRQVAPEAANAVLPLHPFGKAQPQPGGIQAQKTVEPVIFFP